MSNKPHGFPEDIPDHLAQTTPGVGPKNPPGTSPNKSLGTTPDSDAAPLSDSDLVEVTDPLQEMQDHRERLTIVDNLLTSSMNLAAIDTGSLSPAEVEGLIKAVKNGEFWKKSGERPLSQLIAHLKAKRGEHRFAISIINQLTDTDIDKAVFTFILALVKESRNVEPAAGQVKTLIAELLKKWHKGKPFIEPKTLFAVANEADEKNFIAEAIKIGLPGWQRPDEKGQPKHRPGQPERPPAASATGAKIAEKTGGTPVPASFQSLSTTGSSSTPGADVLPIRELNEQIGRISKVANLFAATKYRIFSSIQDLDKLSSENLIEKTREFPINIIFLKELFARANAVKPGNGSSEGQKKAHQYIRRMSLKEINSLMVNIIVSAFHLMGQTGKKDKEEFASLLQREVLGKHITAEAFNEIMDTNQAFGTTRFRQFLVEYLEANITTALRPEPGNAPNPNIPGPPAMPIGMRAATASPASSARNTPLGPPPRVAIRAEVKENAETILSDILILVDSENNILTVFPLFEGLGRFRIGGDENAEVTVMGAVPSHAEIKAVKDGFEITSNLGALNIRPIGTFWFETLGQGATKKIIDQSIIELIIASGNIRLVFCQGQQVEKEKITQALSRKLESLQRELVRRLHAPGEELPYKKPENIELYKRYGALKNCARYYKSKYQLKIDPLSPDPVDEAIAEQVHLEASNIEIAGRLSERVQAAADAFEDQIATDAVASSFKLNAKQRIQKAFVEKLKQENPGCADVHTAPGEIPPEGEAVKTHKCPVLIITNVETGTSTVRPVLLEREYIGSHKGSSTIELPPGKKGRAATIERSVNGGFQLVWHDGQIEPVGKKTEFKPVQSLDAPMVIEQSLIVKVEENHLYTDKALKIEAEKIAEKLMERVVDVELTTAESDLVDLKKILELARSGLIDSASWSKKLREDFERMLEDADKEIDDPDAFKVARYLETIALLKTNPELQAFVKFPVGQLAEIEDIAGRHAANYFGHFYNADAQLVEPQPSKILGIEIPVVGKRGYKEDLEVYKSRLDLKTAGEPIALQGAIQIARFLQAGINLLPPPVPADSESAASHDHYRQKIHWILELRKKLQKLTSGGKSKSDALIQLFTEFSDSRTNIGQIFNPDEIEDINREQRIQLTPETSLVDYLKFKAAAYARECFIQATQTADNILLLKIIDSLLGKELIKVNDLIMPPYDRKEDPVAEIAEKLRIMREHAAEYALAAKGVAHAEAIRNTAATRAGMEARREKATFEAQMLEVGRSTIITIQTATALGVLLETVRGLQDTQLDEFMEANHPETWERIKQQTFPARVRSMAKSAAKLAMEGKDAAYNSELVRRAAQVLNVDLSEFDTSDDALNMGLAIEKTSKRKEELKEKYDPIFNVARSGRDPAKLVGFLNDLKEIITIGKMTASSRDSVSDAATSGHEMEELEVNLIIEMAHGILSDKIDDFVSNIELIRMGKQDLSQKIERLSPFDDALADLVERGFAVKNGNKIVAVDLNKLKKLFNN